MSKATPAHQAGREWKKKPGKHGSSVDIGGKKKKTWGRKEKRFPSAKSV